MRASGPITPWLSSPKHQSHTTNEEKESMMQQHAKPSELQRMKSTSSQMNSKRASLTSSLGTSSPASPSHHHAPLTAHTALESLALEHAITAVLSLTPPSSAAPPRRVRSPPIVPQGVMPQTSIAPADTDEDTIPHGAYSNIRAVSRVTSNASGQNGTYSTMLVPLLDDDERQAGDAQQLRPQQVALTSKPVTRSILTSSRSTSFLAPANKRRTLLGTSASSANMIPFSDGSQFKSYTLEPRVNLSDTKMNNNVIVTQSSHSPTRRGRRRRVEGFVEGISLVSREEDEEEKTADDSSNGYTTSTTTPIMAASFYAPLEYSAVKNVVAPILSASPSPVAAASPAPPSSLLTSRARDITPANLSTHYSKTGKIVPIVENFQQFGGGGGGGQMNLNKNMKKKNQKEKIHVATLSQLTQPKSMSHSASENALLMGYKGGGGGSASSTSLASSASTTSLHSSSSSSSSLHHHHHSPSRHFSASSTNSSSKYRPIWHGSALLSTKFPPRTIEDELRQFQALPPEYQALLPQMNPKHWRYRDGEWRKEQERRMRKESQAAAIGQQQQQYPHHLRKGGKRALSPLKELLAGRHAQHHWQNQGVQQQQVEDDTEWRMMHERNGEEKEQQSTHPMSSRLLHQQQHSEDGTDAWSDQEGGGGDFGVEHTEKNIASDDDESSNNNNRIKFYDNNSRRRSSTTNNNNNASPSSRPSSSRLSTAQSHRLSARNPNLNTNSIAPLTSPTNNNNNNEPPQSPTASSIPLKLHDMSSAGYIDTTSASHKWRHPNNKLKNGGGGGGGAAPGFSQALRELEEGSTMGSGVGVKVRVATVNTTVKTNGKRASTETSITSPSSPPPHPSSSPTSSTTTSSHPKLPLLTNGAYEIIPTAPEVYAQRMKNASAVQIQKVWRGFTTRKEVALRYADSSDMNSSVQERIKMDHAAGKIQKVWRGYHTRKAKPLDQARRAAAERKAAAALATKKPQSAPRSGTKGSKKKSSSQTPERKQSANPPPMSTLAISSLQRNKSPPKYAYPNDEIPQPPQQQPEPEEEEEEESLIPSSNDIRTEARAFARAQLVAVNKARAAEARAAETKIDREIDRMLLAEPSVKLVNGEIVLIPQEEPALADAPVENKTAVAIAAAADSTLRSFLYDQRQATAATCIQRLVRGKKARKMVGQLRKHGSITEMGGGEDGDGGGSVNMMNVNTNTSSSSSFSSSSHPPSIDPTLIVDESQLEELAKRYVKEMKSYVATAVTQARSYATSPTSKFRARSPPVNNSSSASSSAAAALLTHSTTGASSPVRPQPIRQKSSTLSPSNKLLRGRAASLSGSNVHPKPQQQPQHARSQSRSVSPKRELPAATAVTTSSASDLLLPQSNLADELALAAHEHIRHLAATRIQALVRGRQARQRYHWIRSSRGVLQIDNVDVSPQLLDGAEVMQIEHEVDDDE